MSGLEQKNGYIIIDKRTPKGKEFADIRDESIEIAELSMSLSGIYDCFQYNHKKPGQAIKYWQETKRFSKIDKLKLKTDDEVSKKIKCIVEEPTLLEKEKFNKSNNY